MVLKMYQAVFWDCSLYISLYVFASFLSLDLYFLKKKIYLTDYGIRVNSRKILIFQRRIKDYKEFIDGLNKRNVKVEIWEKSYFSQQQKYSE